MILGPIFTDSGLKFESFQKPVLASGEVLVKVAFAGLNRADAQQARGKYPPPPGASPVLGLECSGVISAIGSDVGGFAVGDRVMGLLTGGAFGTYAVMNVATVLKVLPHMSMEEAAALPESLYTFWLNAVMEGGLRPGGSFLIHGGAAGLGSFSVSMAAAMGCRVVSSARGEARCAFVRGLGAAHVVDTSFDGFLDRLRECGKVDVVLDHIGAEYLETHVSMLNRLGSLVLINAASPGRGQLDMGSVLMKRLRIVGSLLRSRGVEEKAGITASLRESEFGLRLLERVRVPVDSVIPVAEIDRALARLEARESLGKIVLAVG